MYADLVVVYGLVSLAELYVRIQLWVGGHREEDTRKNVARFHGYTTTFNHWS